MRPSVRGIWIGLLVLTLGSASARFLLFALQNPVPSLAGLIFNFSVIVVVIVAVWTISLRFVEARQRRQVAKIERRYPGAVTFPSLPTAELVTAARLIDPEAAIEIDGADALTIQLDISGVTVRHRGRDSITVLLQLAREQVLDVSSREVPGRFGSHPSIAVVLQTGDGLIPLVFPMFQPARPFRRASPVEAQALVEEAKSALNG